MNTKQNNTIEQVRAEVERRIAVARSLGDDSMVHYSAVADLLASVSEMYVAAHKSETASLRALVKELADAFESDIKGVCWYCGKHRGLSVDDVSKCLDSLPKNGICETIKEINNSLIARAREV